MAAAYRFLHFTITSPQNLVLNYTQTCPDIAWSELHWRIEPWQHRRVLSQGRKHWDARKIGWCLAWTMDDNGLSWRLCFNLYELNYYNQMWDNWDSISTYKTTAAERNWLKLPPKTEVWPCCWNSIRLPILSSDVSASSDANDQYVLNQSPTHSSTFTIFIPIHWISAWWSTLSIWEARPPKCTTGCTMGAAATMLRESEFNVSGGRSCMKPLERAAKTSWKYNGARDDWSGLVRWEFPKLLDWWGGGQIGAKIEKSAYPKASNAQILFILSQRASESIGLLLP